VTLLFRCGAPTLCLATACAIVWIGSPGWASATSGIMFAGLLGTAGLSILYFTSISRMVPVRVPSALPFAARDAADLERFDFERG
jgi:hypothetical protein